MRQPPISTSTTSTIDEAIRHSNGPKDIIHRDQVHGDVQYDRLSVSLLNMSSLQRLGRVYQLGYSHLVYRGGTHTRLSHVMGAAHMAGKIVDALKINYRQNRAARPLLHVSEPNDFLPCRKKIDLFTYKYLTADRWDVLRHLVTWAALLHDLGHVPLGHTLEDEFEGIFKKHDDFASPRSIFLWGAKSEAYQVLTNQTLYPSSFVRCEIDPDQVWQTVMLICYFKDIPKILRAKCRTFSDYLTHTVREAARELKENPSDSEKRDYENHRKIAKVLHEAFINTGELFHPYMTDVVANTICADYLDYVRRDPLNVGLDVLRDDRILSSFYVGSDSTGLRMALALLDRHGKARLDVCTGVVEQVRQRYRFAESIYYHKTKVSASAMFAKAMALIGKPSEVGHEQELLFDKGHGIKNTARSIVRSQDAFSTFKAKCLPSALMHPEMGDEGLHLWLMYRALENIEREAFAKGTSNGTKRKANRSSRIATQLRGVSLLQGIARRRLYKISFSIDATHFGKLTKGAAQEGVVESRLQSTLDRLRKNKDLRDDVERRLAKEVGWPEDSILLYVPPRKNQAKGIDTFAFDGNGLVRLNEHEAVSEKVNELGRDYRDLWRLLVLTHPAYQEENLPLSEVADLLAKQFWADFPNDDELSSNNLNLHDEEKITAIREIAWFPYIRRDHRGAAEWMMDLSPGLPNGMKIDWEMFERVPVLSTDSEHSLPDVLYADRAFVIQCLVRGHGMGESEAIEKLKDRRPKASQRICAERFGAIPVEMLSNARGQQPKMASDDIQYALDLVRVAKEIATASGPNKLPRQIGATRLRRRNQSRRAPTIGRSSKKKAV
jgi:HD superfamily phosphohydrolase